MASLNRRDFLKALGITGSASVVSACGLDNNYYRTPIEEILPYVVRPEQVIPGNPTFFATTVTTGPHAHPVLARHRDGRVIHVGRNPEVPFEAGVPSAALFELQRHYSPDRVREPMADGKAVAWQDGLQQLADAVKGAKDGGKKVVFLGSHRSGAIVDLVRDFTGGEAIFWEPLGPEAEALAAEKLFGQRLLPAWDLSKAHYVLSFGADFLGTWGSQRLQSQYAAARNPNEGHFVARFALVSPHRGQTGANADDWFAAAPGTEALVAMAVARLVAEKANYGGPLAALVAAADVDAAAQASGLTKEQIEGIAAQFAAAPAVALPGGIVGATKAATDLAVAAFVLNMVSGNAGVTFGVGPHYAGPIDGLARVEALVADLNAGNVGVLLVDDHTNPVYALPESLGFAAAMGKAGLVVALSSHRDETTALAKLVLPTSDVFEDWGDEEPAVGLHLLRQPSMSPMYDTRSLGDVLLATARAAGLQAASAQAQDGQPAQPAPAAGAAAGAAAAAPAADAALGFGPNTWHDYLRARWQQRLGQDGFETAWTNALMNGFVDQRPALTAPEAGAAPTVGGSATVEGTGDYVLIAYPHAFRFDGRYANEPWAQEVPDPMTGNVWGSWVEIHPTTADKLGLADKSVVEVTTANGTVQLAVERYPYVREDVIAIAFGQGHVGTGRYADQIGVNVVKLLGLAKDESGAMAWQNAKASLKATGAVSELPTTFGADHDFARGFGVVVSATELAKVGDAAAAHPGELTGIHHLELDERLTSKGITDMYGLPDHPNYRFGMTVDTNACNGCGVCAIACYAENNLPVVGPQKVDEGREMGWIRVNRYYGGDEGGVDDIRFVPMMCQHCGHAPCESVCPVLATYHTIDGLNAMIYNRCVGTRYCANNCPYSVRRFNWHSYAWPEPFNLQLNPEVTTRTMGVMEKCTFCVQRIRSTKSAYRNAGFTNLVPDDALRRLPACAESCPTGALTFGNLNDPESGPSKSRQSTRTYEPLGDLNTFPAINYLAKASYHPPAVHHAAGAGEHEPAASHGGEHAPAAPEGGDHNPPAQPH